MDPASPSAKGEPGGLIAEVSRLDAALYEAIARTGTPGLDRAMARLTSAADRSRISLALAAALAALGGREGRGAAAAGLASVAVTATVVNAILKPLWRRRRPARAEHERAAAATVRMPLTHSFPSGHSAAAFAFAAGTGRRLPWTTLPLGGLAALVSYSRVHTGVHYPTDVLAGALCGVGLAEITVSVLDRRSGPRADRR